VHIGTSDIWYFCKYNSIFEFRTNLKINKDVVGDVYHKRANYQLKMMYILSYINYQTVEFSKKKKKSNFAIYAKKKCIVNFACL
jgi:hypothetical protein